MSSPVEATLTLKAAATATDHGAFSAIAAAYTLDRDGEYIRPGAFKSTIEAWQGRGNPIPLHWAHKGDAENIIGRVDPATMRETDDGLYVEATLDLEGSKVAQEAWRLVKSGTVGLSFGFLGEMGEKNPDGTREIVNVDLFEVSLTPAPANPDTKILHWKSADNEPMAMELQEVKDQLAKAMLEVEDLRSKADVTEGSVDPLRRRSDELALDVLSGGKSAVRPPPRVEEPAPDLTDLRELRRQSRNLISELLSD